MGEVRACKPWLEAEIALIHPRVVVCLGATAAQALLGRQFKLTEHRGKFVDWPLDPLVTAMFIPRRSCGPATTKPAAWERSC